MRFSLTPLRCVGLEAGDDALREAFETWMSESDIVPVSVVDGLTGKHVPCRGYIMIPSQSALAFQWLKNHGATYVG